MPQIPHWDALQKNIAPMLDLYAVDVYAVDVDRESAAKGRPIMTDLRLAEHKFGFVLVAVLGSDGQRRILSRAKSYKSAKAKISWYDRNQENHGVTMHPIPEGATVELRDVWTGGDA